MPLSAISLRRQISGFLRHIHAEAGNSIRHITIIVHGQPDCLEDGLYTEHLSLAKPQGAQALSYQHFKLDGPIDNMVTLVATRKMAGPGKTSST